MDLAYPYASTDGYEVLDNIVGVDPKDQHVAKAAIHVVFNQKYLKSKKTKRVVSSQSTFQD